MSLWFFLGALLAQAEESVSLRGVLLERGTRRPLSQVTVYVLPHTLKAVTDSHGEFVMENVPQGKFQWVVNHAGYIRLDREALTEEAVQGETLLFLEKQTYQAYETTVIGKEDRRDDTKKSLKASELIQLPGTGGDPIKAVQNLPGVNRTFGLNSQVVIQGSSPIDTRYAVDGHEVPLMFHFGGLGSVVAPEAIDQVDYLSAGYGPEYGRALGGIIGVWTKSPEKDRFHGMGFVDIFNAGFMLDTPLTENSGLLIGARRSYVGEVLKQTLPQSKNFNLTVAPSFTDVATVYETRFTPDDRFRLVGIGSNDQLEFLFSQPVNQDPTVRGTFSNQTSFVRLIPQYEHRHSHRLLAKTSVGFGRDWIRVDLNDKYFSLNSTSLSARAEVENKNSSKWTSQWGLDSIFTWAKVDLALPSFYMQGGVGNPVSGSELKRVDVQNNYSLLGTYWRNEFVLGDSLLRLLPNLRAEYYSPTREGFLLPRGVIRYLWDDSLTLKAGGGAYAQPPLEQEVDPTYGNPDVKAPRSWHLFVGADKDFREGGSQGWILAGNIFYKSMTNLVQPSSRLVSRGGVTVSENYRNDGSGEAYGGSVFGKWFSLPWSGMFSYTLSRSVRSDSSQLTYLSQYDQSHILVLLGAVELGRNWRLSARVRFASGNPITPVEGGYFDGDNDVYVPQRGAFFSERVSPFYQVDVRVDKKWVYNTWMLSAYLDIQNLTNRQNIENIRYSYDYSTRSQVTGLPILPTFGLKAEF